MRARVLTVIASLSLILLFASTLGRSRPAARGLLVVANQFEHTALLVDPETRREVAKIVVGVNGHEVAVSKDGRFAYVPIYGNSGVGKPGTDGTSIDVVDIRERKLAYTIDLGKPLRPHEPAIGPDGQLYVTAELSQSLDAIDPATRKVIAENPTGQPESHMFVITPGWKSRLYRQRARRHRQRSRPRPPHADHHHSRFQDCAANLHTARRPLRFYA